MRQAQIDPDGLYTIQQVGDLTAVGYFNAYRWARRGTLPTVRFGRAFVVKGSDLLDTMGKWQRKEIDLDMPRFGSVRELVAAR
jgi:excisionase family DNA binding protein